MIRRILKYILIVSGCLSLILVILCLTSAPFWTWYKMSVKYAGIHRPPDAIVILGGGGMPSESGLMRCWYGAKAGNYYYRARIIIALPGDTADSMSSIRQMKKELILRGIQGNRIILESTGTNTRAQALNVYKIIESQPHVTPIQHMTSVIFHQPSYIPEGAQPAPKPGSGVRNSRSGILIITSPEHMYRAYRSFRKAGFIKTDGVPAFEQTIESGLTFDDRLLGGKRWMPSIGKNITLRYQFWTQLRYEQLIIREWLAIAYYKLNGWL